GSTACWRWAIGGPSGRTFVELISFDATGYDKGVLLEWKTGFEADNLGFNVYRDQSGNRTLVNAQLVAGSALGAGSTLLAGQSYAWFDNTESKDSGYWLEDIDLKGLSTWHGPFYAKQVGGQPPSRRNPSSFQRAKAARSMNRAQSSSTDAHWKRPRLILMSTGSSRVRSLACESSK